MSYVHDSENRLLSATNAVWSVGYAYDPNGRRLAISSSQYADMSFVHAGDMDFEQARAKRIKRQRKGGI